MIVRAILDNPDIADKFDHFNDFDNTLNWLKRFEPSEKRDLAIRRLENSNMRYRIAYTIRHMLPHYLADNSLAHPYDINCGLCEDFALSVIDKFGGESDALEMVWVEDVKDTPAPNVAHAVICLKMMSWDDCVYFDSECPQGTTDLSTLPVVVNQGKTRKEIVGSEF